ncbi:MAG: NAD-binding protein [Haloarculaceae archaeon]
MQAVFVGPDEEGLVDALREQDVDVRRIEGVADGDALAEAGVGDADLFVLTDAGQATAVVVAREQNPDVRIVAYTDDSLPEFVSGQEVLAVDPALLGPDAVAEELTG